MKDNQSNTINHWRGLGHWNFYFLLKFGLMWYGYLNFHPLANLVFIAFLIFPIQSKRIHIVRHILAIPIGVGLFYYDTWLPSFKSILNNKDNLLSFSGNYLIELTYRFINWPLVGFIFAAFVIYLYLAQWLRITTINIIAIIWINLQPLLIPFLQSNQIIPTITTQVGIPPAPMADVQAPLIAQNSPTSNSATNPIAINTNNNRINNAPATTETLNAYLENFYQKEKQRYTRFPETLAADATPFDILIINICSLALSDIQAAGLVDHPLWNRLDISFNQFNSATSYSGPAAIRLLRASCGQTAHTDLYQSVDKKCFLLDNLSSLGFGQKLLMDHSGVFDDYLIHLRSFAGITAPLDSQLNLASKLVSFNGEPIYQDDLLLNRWLDERTKETNQPRVATFMNMIALHDGNYYIDSKTTDYKTRAQVMLDNLNTFLDTLEKSGRKVLVAIVPEHGAALVGDKMQIPGLRDIPSLNITHVPAGIKLIGVKSPHQGMPIKIDQPTSYLALSELIARLIDGKLFNAEAIDWQALTQNLPRTSIISENENAIVMQYEGKAYVRLSGGDWIAYPQ